jgi:2-oxoisovalerate dehydrogenase E1 component
MMPDLASADGVAIPGDRADLRRDILRTMIRSREFDRRAGVCYRQGGTWFHISSAGHEALAAVAGSLRPCDVIAPHYRDRALLLARGMTLTDMARDLLATATSSSGGRNMTSHFSSRERNVLSLASPVGSNCLPAAGMAWAAALRGEQSVVLACVGDASTRQGEFFEAVAFAIERSLPVVFLIEDNKYGISMPTAGTTAFALGMLPRHRCDVIDGSDADRVAHAAALGVHAARAGEGPRILWCELDRLDSHTSSDDQRGYRKAEELAALRDPIEILAARLTEEQALDKPALEALRARAREEVAEAFGVAGSEPRPDPFLLTEHLYGKAWDKPASTPGIDKSQETATRGLPTLAESVRDALREALADPRAILFGEDVADPKGGVFGLTRGLGAHGLVVNSPLAEATIVGVSIGLALAGMRPLAELQFIDFAGPAWNQITSQLATMRWRTAGAWACPVILYAPWGGYLPGGGIWHSQSNESLLTHVPGLRVAVVADGSTAAAILAEAMAGDDPVVVLLPKHLMRQRPQPGPAPVPHGRGRAAIVRRGTDATVVAWGNGVEIGLSAAATLAARGIDLELVDLRWLSPCDLDTVASSLRRTGRLVVLQEDTAPSSFGAWLIAALAGADDAFFSLCSPPQLVSRVAVHVPYDIGLEEAALPSADDLIAAVVRVLGQEG